MGVEPYGDVVDNKNQAESLHRHLDELALKRGGAEGSIRLERSSTLWFHLVEGTIIGGVVTFFGKQREQLAHLCRLIHLQLDANERDALLVALNTSYKLWFGIDKQAQLTLGNPTLLLTASEHVTLAERSTAYMQAQSCLDLLYADWVIGLSTRPGLMARDEGRKAGAGAVWPRGLAPSALAPPPKRMPGALLQSHSVDASLAFPGSSGLNSVEACRANALAWFRRARLEDSRILKFIAYWIAMESCFPPDRRVKLREVGGWVGILFGHIENMASISQTPGLKQFLGASPTNTNEFHDEWRKMCRLRADIVHFGARPSELAVRSDTDLATALYLLRIHVVPSCLSVLVDAESEGIDDIERVWPSHALAYVMSPRFHRGDYFRRSFYASAPKELPVAHDHSV